MNREKAIIIGGGVGPLAGVELHRRIIENTRTDGTDQDHLSVYHLSRSSDIGDRTDYLAGRIKENPALGMFRSIELASESVQKTGSDAVVGIPCNTFHAPEIFDHLLQLIDRSSVNVQLLHLLEETFRFLEETLPRPRRIGILTTTGTRSAGLYQKGIRARGLDIVEIPEELQPQLHDAIYNIQWGLKAQTPVSVEARSLFEKYVSLLMKDGAEVIILGCTEIPLALPEGALSGIPLIDPLLALARALIREANSRKLKPRADKTGERR
jgi:aspartate racemase